MLAVAAFACLLVAQPAYPINAALAGTKGGGVRLVWLSQELLTQADSGSLVHMACDADCTQAANWKNHTTSFKGDMAKIGMTLAIAEDDVPALAISGHFSAGIATCTAACADATDWGTPRLITSPELVQSFPLQVPNCGGATWQQYAGSTIAFDAEKKPRIAFAAQIVTPLCGVAGYGGFLFLP